MAEQEEALEGEGRMTARRPAGGSPHVELKSFSSGEEALGSSKRSPGAKSATPTTSSVASEGRTDADLHAPALASQLDSLSLAQSSTPSAAANSPSFRIQFTTATGESLTPLHSLEHHTHHTGSRDEIDLSHTDQALEELLTSERDDDRRDSLTEVRVRVEDDGAGADRSGLHQPVSNLTVFDDATRDLDSSGHGSAVSTPIAAPSNGDTSREPAASSVAHSFARELGVSPYVVVKGGLADVSQYESPGLLYARAAKERHNLDMLRPPDEVAEDVLETIHGDVSQKLSWAEGERGGEEEEEEEEEGERDDKDEAYGEGDEGEWRKSARRKEGYRKSHSIESRGRIEDLDLSQEVLSMSSLELSTEVPLDPNALRDLERHAQKVASNLEYIMDNLRNSLHAMTVCAKQSVMLHRESVDNLHAVVDSNVKATYSFLAKFEELKRHTVPLNDLAQQIRDINEILKIFERGFRTA